MHFEFAYFFFFLIQLELKRQLGSYIPVVISSKIISDSRQKWANIYPFLDQNDAKTLPFGAPHTQMAYVRENPPPPPHPPGTWSWSEWVKRAETISACLL